MSEPKATEGQRRKKRQNSGQVHSQNRVLKTPISGQSGHSNKEKTENMGFGRADDVASEPAMGHPQSVGYSKCQRAR